MKFWAAEILADGEREALIIDLIYGETGRGGGYEICDPAVYMLNERVKDATSLLSKIDEKQFKDVFDAKMKKLTKWSFLNKNNKSAQRKRARNF